MAQIIKTQGYILRTNPFKESSLFASILTMGFGKIRILAKGCRRPRSKLCGALEPFNKDEIIYYRRESKEAYTLSDAQVLERYHDIRREPYKVHAALLLCEFFDKTLPTEEPDREAFNLLEAYIRKLAMTNPQSVKALALHYLFLALPGAGVRPHLDDCVKCHQRIDSRGTIDFSIGTGGVVCEKDYDDTVVTLNTQTVQFLKDAYRSPEASIDQETATDLAKIVGNYLYTHLNNLSLNALKHFL